MSVTSVSAGSVQIDPKLLNASEESSQSVLDQADDLESQIEHETSLKKTKQKFKGWTLMWLAYQSLGVIYGDIGTSPLYVYSSTFTSNPSHEDLVGALSIIIWSLTLIVTVKYVLIVLRADDDGEGGTFALYSLIARYAKVGEKSTDMHRYATGDLSRPTRGIRYFMEHSAVAKVILKFAGVVGISLIIADGVLTPAQSVLGAIQGIRVVHPDLATSTIIGISCAILVLLFLVQPLGISKVSSAFAPIVILWLGFNFVIGIFNLAKYDASVLKAFSPFYAGNYFVRNGTDGWKSLGGLLLAFTGVEALFADLGAFGMRAIQISWVFFTYPCLLLAYIGQAAFISQDPTGLAYTNPFFNTVPHRAFYPALVLSILAAIVASQAIITATFQLLQQIMNLQLFPRLNVIRTSKKFHGQIYISLANWLLMCGTVIVTGVFNNTTSLGNAYGVCVVFVTMLTTCMVSVVALVVWKINFFIVGFVFLTFAALDGAYLSSVIIKVPNGAWVTLMLAFLLTGVCLVWDQCKHFQKSREQAAGVEPDKLLALDQSGNLCLRGADKLHPLARIGGIGVFYDQTIERFPPVVAQFFSKFRARHDVIVLLHLRAMPIPYVPEIDKVVVMRTWIPGCYRIIVRYGYAEDVTKENWDVMIVEHLTRFVHSDQTSTVESETLLNASADQITYFEPHKRYSVAKYNIAKRYLLQFFAWIDVHTDSSVNHLRVSHDRNVTLGYTSDL